jgi:hypothetical protein
MTTEPTARVDAMSQVCAKSFEERRASPRQRRFNGAKIVFNNNSSVIDCIVRDLSAHGARLVVASFSGENADKTDVYGRNGWTRVTCRVTKCAA